MTQISVMIADDHPLIVEGLTSVLTRHGLKVVGSSSVASTVADTVATLQPDVLVLEMRFGDGDIGSLAVLLALQARQSP